MHALLARLREEDRRVVLQSTVRRRFAKGEVIFHAGDPGDTLHLIVRGLVAVRATTLLGDVATFAVLGDNDFFGELALVGGRGRRTATVAAVTATETLSLDRAAVDDLRSRHRAIDELLLEALAKQVERLSQQLLEALYVPVEKRLFRRLADLCDDTSPDNSCSVPLSQAELATLVGTTRPTANRLLKLAESDGLLTLHRGRVEIRDIDAVRRRARGL